MRLPRMTIVCFVFLSEAAWAQLSVSAGIGIGTFRMEQLKKYSRDLQAFTPVTTKSFGNYGPYVGYEANVSYTLADRHRIGVTGGFTSTGSLTTRTDYSGSVNYRNVISARMLAIQYGLDLYSEGKLNISPSMQMGALFTKYKFEYEITLNDGESPPVQKQDFRSTSLMISPGLVFRYKLTGALSASADLRYLLDLKAELRYDKDDKTRLVGSDNKPTSSDWSGFRGTLSIEYRF